METTPKLNWHATYTLSFHGYEATIAVKDDQVTWCLYCLGKLLNGNCPATSATDAQLQVEERIAQNAAATYRDLMQTLRR